MALIFSGQTECSSCNVIINDNDDIAATTHFISDSNDPLRQFSDSAMHKSCFLKVEGQTGNQLSVVSREGLIKMKRLAGRPQDLADVLRLENEES